MEKKKETKRFDLMEFGSALGREEMKKLMAGSEGGGGDDTPCALAIRNADGSWSHWTGCTFTVDQALFYYSDGQGWTYSDGSYVSGYCCESCSHC